MHVATAGKGDERVAPLAGSHDKRTHPTPVKHIYTAWHAHGSPGSWMAMRRQPFSPGRIPLTISPFRSLFPSRCCGSLRRLSGSVASNRRRNGGHRCNSSSRCAGRRYICALCTPAGVSLPMSST
eukprot:2433096-Prymnesium_polylepis.3